MAKKGRAKKSGVPVSEVRKWLDRLKWAEKVRTRADERFGWSRCLKQYSGDFISTMPTFMSGISIVPINEIHGYVKAFMPSVYSRDPHVSFNPIGAQSIGSCKLLELGVNAYWRELRLKRQVRRAIFDAIFAEGFIKSGYSADLGWEEGEQPLEVNEFIRNEEIYCTRVPWKMMVRDPDAVDGLHDARFVAQKIIKPIEAVRDNARFTAKDLRPTHSFDPTTELGKRQQEGGMQEEYLEYWEVHDADTNKIMVVSEGCDDFMCDPEDMPYRFDGYCFDLLRFNQLEDECYGPNLIEPWIPQLWEKIKIRSMELDHLKRFNRQMSAKAGTLKPDQLQKFTLGQTGAVIEFEGDIPPQPIPYPQIQTDIYAVESRIDTDKDNISGQPNAVRSAPQRTQSRTLGEVDRLISAFQGRQMDPQSEVEDFCGDVATKLAALMQDYLPADKWVRVTQEDLPAIVQAFGKERFDGRGFKFSKEDIEGAEFQVDVKVGSTLPLDRQNRIETMVNLLKLGPTMGIQPGGEVSAVIGKNILAEFEMKEIELAFEKFLTQMRTQQTVAAVARQAQMGLIQDKIAAAKGLMAQQDGPQPAGGAQ
jgi:hypothetical protein